MTLNFIPRPSQEQILRYRGGRLGIAAVPGAGNILILAVFINIALMGFIFSNQWKLIRRC